MPLPTFLRYAEGRISSACHWHQFLHLLSLSRTVNCLVNYSELGFAVLAVKRPPIMGDGRTLISKQAVRPDNTVSQLRPVADT